MEGEEDPKGSSSPEAVLFLTSKPGKNKGIFVERVKPPFQINAVSLPDDNDGANEHIDLEFTLGQSLLRDEINKDLLKTFRVTAHVQVDDSFPLIIELWVHEPHKGQDSDETLLFEWRYEGDEEYQKKLASEGKESTYGGKNKQGGSGEGTPGESETD